MRQQRREGLGVGPEQRGPAEVHVALEDLHDEGEVLGGGQAVRDEVGEEGQDLLATVRGVAQGGPPQHQGVLEHGCRLGALWVRRVLQ